MIALLVVATVAAGLWAYLEFTNPLPTPDAAPDPETPAAGPARALPPGDVRRCATGGHTPAPVVDRPGRLPICTRCGTPVERRNPYDRVAVELADLENMWRAS